MLADFRAIAADFAHFLRFAKAQLGFNLTQAELNAEGWRLERPEVLRLLEKLKSRGTPLGEYIEGKFYNGIKTGYNEAFVVDRVTRDKLVAEDKASAKLLKPFLRGRDVKRWQVESDELFLIKIESSENRKHEWSGKSNKEAEKVFAAIYPAIHKRFDEPERRRELIKRYDQGRYFWELRSCKYWEEFEQAKIAYPNICKRNEFAWDEEGFYTNQKTFIIPNTSKFLLGYLNSLVVNWLFDKLLTKLQNGFYEPSAIYMREFPIPSAADWQKEIIEKLVDYILFLTKKDAAQHKLLINYFEAIINALVYELFIADELHAAGKHFFEPLRRESLPSLADHAGSELQIIRELFERLSARDNPIRYNLNFLHDLESVRIIEGKA